MILPFTSVILVSSPQMQYERECRVHTQLVIANARSISDKCAARFMTPVRAFLGYPYPLGATWMGNGVNFALFSETAASVELCLFANMEATEEYVRIPVREHTDQVWHVFLPDVRPGQLYGFRV